MKRVLVTGASGFVGTQLLATLADHGLPARAAVRSDRPNAPNHALHDLCVVGPISGATDWRQALEGCDAVVHLAARVHVMYERDDAAAECREINTEATRALATQAAAAGVRRFIFASTAKVHGEGRPAPYTEHDAPEPRDTYARSKWQAERALREIAVRSGLGATILRIPLVYGPGVGGNFLRLMDAIDSRRLLPLGCIDNRRSLIYVGNLADVIVNCLANPAAAQRTFLVSDGEDVSTPDLVRRLGSAMGRPARLLPIPAGLLRVAGSLSRRSAELGRLLDSFSLESGAIREALDWSPPFSLDMGLAKTAAWYLGQDGKR